MLNSETSKHKIHSPAFCCLRISNVWVYMGQISHPISTCTIFLWLCSLHMPKLVIHSLYTCMQDLQYIHTAGQFNLTCCITLLLGLQYKCIVSAYIIQLCATCVGVIKSHPKIVFFVTSDADFLSYEWPVYQINPHSRVIASCRMLVSKCWFITQQVLACQVEVCSYVATRGSQIEFSVHQQKLLVQR